VCGGIGLFPSGVSSELVGLTEYSNQSGDSIWAGINQASQFESTINHHNTEDDQSDYLIAKFNPNTNQLVVSDSVALVSIRNLPNRLKRAADDAIDSSYIQQRTQLGLAFGTKKAIRELNTQQRNKLDQSSFGTSKSLSNLLQSEIQTQSSSLPSTETIEQSANLARPIPTPNLSATHPKHVYDMNQVVPKNEFTSLDLEPIIAADNFKDRHSVFPYRRSRFVQNKLRQLFPAANVGLPLSDKDRTKLGYVYQLSFLFAFRQAATPNKDHNLTRQNLADKLNAPVVVVDGLLNRYTELVQVGNQQKRKLTSTSQAKLISYLCVLILFLDNWSTDVGLVAADLGMGENKVQELFKSLGCSIISPSTGERDRLLELGIAANPAEARRARKATLTVPLQFPKERKTKAKR